MMDSNRTPGHSKTIVLNGWFQSGDQNVLVLEISLSACESTQSSILFVLCPGLGQTGND